MLFFFQLLNLSLYVRELSSRLQVGGLVLYYVMMAVISALSSHHEKFTTLGSTLSLALKNVSRTRKIIVHCR